MPNDTTKHAPAEPHVLRKIVTTLLRRISILILGIQNAGWDSSALSYVATDEGNNPADPVRIDFKLKNTTGFDRADVVALDALLDDKVFQRIELPQGLPANLSQDLHVGMPRPTDGTYHTIALHVVAKVLLPNIGWHEHTIYEATVRYAVPVQV